MADHREEDNLSVGLLALLLDVDRTLEQNGRNDELMVPEPIIAANYALMKSAVNTEIVLLTW